MPTLIVKFKLFLRSRKLLEIMLIIFKNTNKVTTIYVIDLEVLGFR